VSRCLRTLDWDGGKGGAGGKARGRGEGGGREGGEGGEGRRRRGGGEGRRGRELMTYQSIDQGRQRRRDRRV
jgi:hypothetical protein